MIIKLNQTNLLVEIFARKISSKIYLAHIKYQDFSISQLNKSIFHLNVDILIEAIHLVQ